MGFPQVSVIIPAYRAEDTLRRAIESVRHAGLALSEIEIAVAPDDGRDYSRFVPDNMRLAQAELGPVATGVGAARNRAIDVSSGRYLAFLDADDTWEPGYLASALPIARRDGLVFSPTRVLKDGAQIIRTLGGSRITLSDLACSGTSHHPVLVRDLAGRFRDGPSQDVLHSVELLTRNGGEAAASCRAYELRLRDGSVSRTDGFAEAVASAYRDIMSEIGSGRTRVPAAFREVAVDVFRKKLELNGTFAASRSTGFYEFMAESLKEVV